MTLPRLETINATIAAGDELKVNGLEADFLTAYELTGGSLRIKINDRGDYAWFTNGFFYHRGDGRDQIRSVRLRNDEAVAVTVKAVLGTGQWIDQRGLAPAPVLQEQPDVSVPNATATEVIAADPSRKTVILSNFDANASVVRYGGSGIGANEGAELAPGSSVALHTAAAVYVYHTNGSAMSVGLAVLK